MMANGDNLISVIVRSSSESRLKLLDETIFSLAFQDWPDIEVVLVLQNPSKSHQKAVEDIAAGQPWHKNASCRILPVEIPKGVDGRANLLAEGCRAAKGRYLAFLDDDDVVYPHAYLTLISALRKNERAVMAMGLTRTAFIDSVGGYHQIRHKGIVPFNLNQTRFDLLLGNFINIHSYVMDRTRFPESVFKFSTEAVPLEDYDFLLRLAAAGPFDFSCRHIPVCEYRIHEENSVGLGEKPSEAFKRACETLAKTTDNLVMPVSKEDWLEIKEHFCLSGWNPANGPARNEYVPKRRRLVRLADAINQFADNFRDGRRSVIRKIRQKFRPVEPGKTLDD